MKHKLLLFAIIIMCASAVQAQNPMLQATHNAADPGLAMLDVAISSFGIPVFSQDSITFRTALPMVEGIPGIPLDIDISKTNGPSVFSFQITLTSGLVYLGMLQGVENPAQFAPNPDGKDISLNISITQDGRVASTVPGDVQCIFSHGVTDLGTVDVNVSGGSQLANNIAYGDYSGYATLAPGQYIWEITNADGSQIIAAFDVDLSTYADSALTVFMSGFLDPAQNQNGAELALLAALPSGTVMEFPRHLTGITDSFNPTGTVRDYRLYQNFPNPFNPSTTIQFALAESGPVKLTIYNATGQLVQTLIERPMNAGLHQVQWDAGHLPSGIYLYRLETANFSQSRKLVLMR